MKSPAPINTILTAALNRLHPSPFTSIHNGENMWKNEAQLIRAIASHPPSPKKRDAFSYAFLKVKYIAVISKIDDVNSNVQMIYHA